MNMKKSERVLYDLKNFRQLPMLLAGLYVYYHFEKEIGWCMVHYSGLCIADKWLALHRPEFAPYW